jgi:hypothetical protein
MLKSILGNFSVRFSSAIFNLLIAVLVSQFLGAAGKGEQSLILASITIVLLFHNLANELKLILSIYICKLKKYILCHICLHQSP